MDKKFTALRIIGTVYKIAGVLIALGTVLVVIAMIVGGAAYGGGMMDGFGFNGPAWVIIGVISTVIGGGLAALSIYAIGEGLELLINLEENTRFTAVVLRDRFYPPVQNSQPVNAQRPNFPPPPQQPPVV